MIVLESLVLEFALQQLVNLMYNREGQTYFTLCRVASKPLLQILLYPNRTVQVTEPILFRLFIFFFFTSHYCKVVWDTKLYL